MNRDKLISQMGADLVKDISEQAPNWNHLVMVGRFEDDEPAMNGFAYLPDGTAEPVAPMDFGILDTLTELRKAMATEDKGMPWKTAFFRATRSTKELDGEFEYSDPARWSITFKNSKERAEEFRPKS